MKRILKFGYLWMVICCGCILTGCDKSFFDESWKSYATVQINGEEYHHFSNCNWLSPYYPPDILGYCDCDYKLYGFMLFLRKEETPIETSYVLHFYLDSPNKQLKIGKPIQIVSNDYIVSTYSKGGLEPITTLSEERCKSPNYGDEGVCVLSSDSTIVSLEGSFTIQHIDGNIATGSFKLENKNSESNKFLVEGNFEASVCPLK